MLSEAVRQAVAAYEPAPDAVEIELVAGGLINQTYLVRRRGEPWIVVQRLHPIFAAEVNVDIEHVTRHLAAAGLVTPLLVRTVTGDRWVVIDGQVWRALSFVPGRTMHRVPDPSAAAGAGELVGRFHRALANLQYDYAFARAGVHDTKAHLLRLEAALAAADHAFPDADPELIAGARGLGKEILAASAGLPEIGDLPRRHTHGDLKISNILFAESPSYDGRCLVDLDTLGLQTMAYELGDAMRSWCNPGGEDQSELRVDETIFAAAMDGYRRGVGDLLTSAERAAIVPGLETVCVELAARFCVDVFADSYFGWDRTRFASRREHNLVRSRGQLALAGSVRARRAALSRLV